MNFLEVRKYFVFSKILLNFGAEKTFVFFMLKVFERNKILKIQIKLKKNKENPAEIL